MRREKFFCLSFNRFAQASTAALIALVLTGAARADIIKTFRVSGTAQNVTGGTLGSCASVDTCDFSGTLKVDVTSGDVAAVDVTFPGLSVFDRLATSRRFGSNQWQVVVENAVDNRLILDFTTTQVPGSLVGFDGGSFTRFDVFSSPPSKAIYAHLSGSIKPTTTTITTTPEPGTLGLLGTGLIGLAAMARRKLKLST